MYRWSLAERDHAGTLADIIGSSFLLIAIFYPTKFRKLARVYQRYSDPGGTPALPEFITLERIEHLRNVVARR